MHDPIDVTSVAVPRPLVCPVLVGRDDLLALADRRIAEVAAGQGRFLVLAGEAGLGKTRLLGAIERRAVAAGFHTARGGTYPTDLRVAGAVLLDLGRAMTRTGDAAVAATGRSLLATLDVATPGTADVTTIDRIAEGDAHRRRRLMILDAAESILNAGIGGPVLLQVEDLHWSDDLTLEILEAVARRITDVPVLLIGTYRSDELFPRVPMREWRARLLGRREVEEARLRRLGPAETAQMTNLLLGSTLPASRELVAAIEARADGIPLHVEELFALLAASGALDEAAPGAAPQVRAAGADVVPESVEDAIVSRIDRRSPAAVKLAEAGAVIGRSFDLDLLAAVVDTPLDELTEPLAELDDHFLLLPAPQPGRYGFRHALICDAIYARIPEPERRRLHARTAEAAAERADLGGDAFLALHHERAGQRAAAFRSALAGARAAARLSSHGEARALFDVALRTVPADLPVADRAGLLAEAAAAAAAVDDNEAADRGYAEAHAAYLEAGDQVAAAAVVAPHVAVRHLLGDDLASRTQRLAAALAMLPPDGTPLDPADGGTVGRARARLLGAMADAYMLDRRLQAGIEYGTAAQQTARAVGDAAPIRHAAITLGICYVFSGRMDEGWALLEGTLQEALAAHHEAAASRAARMLGSCASVLVEYDRAERTLRDGIEHAERVELWNDRHYMAAHLAHVRWATGRWEDAVDLARHALADGRGGITTRITALHVLGFVALGRGQLDGARGHLAEARELGARMGELQRLSPALWGLAEVALAEGDPGLATAICEQGAAASAEVDDAAYLFPFAVTGVRAALARGDAAAARDWIARVQEPLERRGIPGTLPALDHARGLVALADGQTGVARTALTAAVAGWTDRSRMWESAWARLDLARCHQRANQPSEARRTAAAARAIGERLGAPAILAAADAILGPRGRGGADAGDAPWAPLTAREFDVARRVAKGRTNPEIAEELGISRKTVAAHIEHILAKLGVDRRAEIAAWTAARPVLHSRPHGDDREE